MISLLFVITLLSSPSISYHGLLGELLPYNAYHFVDLIEDGDFSYARKEFIVAESIYQQAYDYALKLKNVKLKSVALISQGAVLGAQGKADFALDKFKQALINKDLFYDRKLSSKLYFNIGAAYHNLNQLDSAIINYTFAIEQDSNYAEAYKNRGLAYYAQNELSNALESYKHTLELKQDYADIMVFIADTYLTKDDRVSAKHWFEKALQNRANLKDFTEIQVQEKLKELNKYIEN